MRADRYLQTVRSPGGTRHLADVRRPERTLCGHGVFAKDGWVKLGGPQRPECQVCGGISRRRYGFVGR